MEKGGGPDQTSAAVHQCSRGQSRRKRNRRKRRRRRRRKTVHAGYIWTAAAASERLARHALNRPSVCFRSHTHTTAQRLYRFIIMMSPLPAPLPSSLQANAANSMQCCAVLYCCAVLCPIISLVVMLLLVQREEMNLLPHASLLFMQCCSLSLSLPLSASHFLLGFPFSFSATEVLRDAPLMEPAGEPSLSAPRKLAMVPV